jgi:hypothetical protein
MLGPKGTKFRSLEPETRSSRTRRFSRFSSGARRRDFECGRESTDGDDENSISPRMRNRGVVLKCMFRRHRSTPANIEEGRSESSNPTSFSNQDFDSHTFFQHPTVVTNRSYNSSVVVGGQDSKLYKGRHLDPTTTAASTHACPVSHTYVEPLL